MAEHCVAAVPLFRELPEEGQESIEKLVRRRDYKKGETLLEASDGAALFIVAEGLLGVYQLSAKGREQLLRIIRPGSYTGETGLFGAVNEDIYIQALEDSEVCVLAKKDFDRLLLKEPSLSIKLLEITARRMKALENQARFLLMDDVGPRLATWLLQLYHDRGERRALAMPMKWKDLALYLGTTPETMSRKLRKLEDEKIIERTGRRVSILDVEKLKNYGE